MRKPLLVLSILLVTACGGSSSSTTASSSSTTSSSGSESYSLAQFADIVTQQAAGSLCAEPSAPLRACFEVNDADCARLFGIAMHECAREMASQLPATVVESNAESVGAQLAECAGTAYGLGLQQSGMVRHTPECQH